MQYALRFMHMCVAKDENPTLNERKNILLQEAAKPTTELDFPSVTVCSPRLNMKAVKEVIFEDFNYWRRGQPTAEKSTREHLDLDFHDGEVRDERWREQHLRNDPGDGLAAEHRRRQSGKKQRCSRIRVG